MSVLNVRPIAEDTCSSGSVSSCGASPPGMNYGGGDCLPGLPGPIPTLTCTGYSSGAPFEGASACPKCEDYCYEEQCWNIEYVTDGKVTFDKGSDHYEWAMENNKRMGGGGVSTPTTSVLQTRGSIKAKATYIGPNPTPKLVRLNIFSRVTVETYYNLGSMVANNGLGDPMINTEYSIYESKGSRIKKLALGDDGTVEVTLFLEGSVSWVEASNVIRYVTPEVVVSVLPCEGDEGVI